jgi:membrane protein DedA with SNARE-associated domain
MQRVYLNGAVMLVMTALGALSLVVLLGTYAYSGSIFPSEQISEGGHAVISWVLWLVFALLLVATAVLWMLRALSTRKK